MIATSCKVHRSQRCATPKHSFNQLQSAVNDWKLLRIIRRFESCLTSLSFGGSYKEA